jgi:2-polyprenyl-3-methyl-5-hydroxy-6-metoxy-1,4-benzoquinol methylase
LSPTEAREIKYWLSSPTQRSAIARDRGIEVLCGFLDEGFTARNGPFDVIVFSDALEHLPSPDDMLKLAIRGLKPGGIILASVPNVAHWSMRLDLLFGRFNYAESGLCDAHAFALVHTEQPAKDVYEAGP